ncbi:CLUMA_CG016923, isoform A [Clunio marinus]|uniref:CLUMA_CG016923, isoform A n=1 Tax=Clunio marinus TaxID=568069 RepID=A0A1J1IW88_9DIPT|nr:CLUMA_CG016923, isoform A [Clunio marinus]
MNARDLHCNQTSSSTLSLDLSSVFMLVVGWRFITLCFFVPISDIYPEGIKYELMKQKGKGRESC